jgi:hypothetical protein
MGTLVRSALGRRLAPLTLVLGLLVGGAVAGCGDRHPTPHVTATAAEIVAQNTQDRLAALPFKKDTDGDTLRAFLAATQSAKSRDDLKSAWTAQASLAAKAPAFLDDVFRFSEGEKKWPKPPDPAAEPSPIAAASVEGVRKGVENFLK